MDTRRDFIKKASLLSGMTALHSFLPESIRKALAIDPTPGSTFMDAEHIVILMQENRSFDHAFGSLQGVRGFNDPRAIRLANGNPVWLQSNAAGETYAPFRLNMKDTKSTWMSSLPHSWKNQVGARNNGQYDQWLNEKRNSIKEYADMPLTLGYYNRQDIPFYYALADGFTICDQHFCSSLTGTTPNRLFFWSGTIRAKQNENSRALVWNDDSDYESLNWKTFPEVLEENKISWKFYQNELSLNVGMTEEEGRWLANFGDNPLEFFKQYNVRLHGKYIDQMRRLSGILPGEISGLKLQLQNLPPDNSQKNIQKILSEKEAQLTEALAALKAYELNNFDSLSEKDKRIHRRAFETNQGDPDYHTLEEISYDDQGELRKLRVPKGDVFYQFRKDVESGNLPTVSWLAAPENLSDHPSSAWFGAWYVSEVMDILTKNPEVWKKTVFILTYDENDGYFDHVPPFVAPHSGKPETGKVSDGIDTRVEYVTVEQEKERNGFPDKFDGESPIGLGYRVPLIIASPWSRGGFVNSQVFDHTSSLRFLESFLNAKTGKPIRAENISEWRRLVSGDLSSVFRPADPNPASLHFLKKNDFLESVYNAKFKKLPDGYHALSPSEIVAFSTNPSASGLHPEQEKGVKPSSGLFYELYANGKFNRGNKSLEIQFEAGDRLFKEKALGSPFNVYAPGNYRPISGSGDMIKMRSWAFAVKASGKVSADWPLADFENELYQLDIYGPNGFFRGLKGSAKDPDLIFICGYDISGVNQEYGNILLRVDRQTSEEVTVNIQDNIYKTTDAKHIIPAANSGQSKHPPFIPISLKPSQLGWYDFTLKIEKYPDFERRFAGRVETGKNGYTDPYMGRVI